MREEYSPKTQLFGPVFIEFRRVEKKSDLEGVFEG
jgi:hypothetical protein